MPRPKCAVKNCMNGAFVAYGTNWICGPCLVKIMEKEKEQKNKMLEELERDLENEKDK